MLKMLFETGHPWITFKDPCNVRSPQDHAGVIHSSNLCTEITLNTSAEETAVCNLGSIVLDEHLTADGEIDHAQARETVAVAVRALDNVIDINFYPTEAARTSNLRHRPIGLGVMGLQYALYRKGLSFDSAEALQFGDELLEAIAYYAYEASAELAGERGALSDLRRLEVGPRVCYRRTRSTCWSRSGASRSTYRGAGVSTGSRCGRRSQRNGMRNSNVLAIAPTATIANIMGTSPCIEPSVQEPLRQVESVGRVRRAQPVSRSRSEATGALEP